MKIVTTLTGILLCFFHLCLLGTNFVIQDLGTLANNESIANSINNHDMVAGRIVEQGRDIDFIWEKEKGLSCLPHQSSYQLPFINNNNTAAGIFWEKTNYWFSKNTRSKHIYLRYSDGTFRDIGVPKKWKAQNLEEWQTPSLWDDKGLGIVGFNDSEQILLANSVNINKATEFAIWHNGDFQYIDPNELSLAYDINKDGLILGRKWIKKEGLDVPLLVLYDIRQQTSIEIMNDVNLANKKFDRQGQVMITQGIKNLTGFLWNTKDGLIPLNDFLPIDANCRNQIVGLKILHNKPVFFLLANGKMFNLNKELEIGAADSIWTEIKTISSINDNCYILGQGVFDGKKHAFVISQKIEQDE